MSNEVEVKNDNAASTGYGVASLVLGIVGTAGMFSLICGVLALIFGILQNKKIKNGFGTAGIVLGCISIGLFILKILFYIFYFFLIIIMFAPMAY